MIIYKTTNNINGKIYVGKARGIRVFNNYLGSGVTLNKAIKKYGKEAFRRQIIDVCESRKDQNRKEIFWIAFYREKLGRDAVYNISDGGDGQSVGFIHSEETRLKISSLLKGNKHPMYGAHHSEEAKRKMSEKHAGITLSDETKLKMRQPKSKEHCKNIGLARLGMKFSDEQRLNMSIANRGKILSEDHKNKISNTLTGRSITEKHRQSLKLAWSYRKLKAVESN